MTRIIDDFGAIRARRDELVRDQAQEPPADLDALAQADLELLLRAIFGDLEKAAAHVEAIEDVPSAVAGRGFELCRVGSERRVGQEYWAGRFGTETIGPFPSLDAALAYIRQLRVSDSL